MPISFARRATWAALLCLGAAACAEKGAPPPPVLDSGITSSNGGGQRALGNLPNVGVSNGRATDTMQSRDPRVPRY